MASEVALSIESQTLDRLGRLIAATAMFQTLVGLPGDPDGALTHVYCPETDDREPSNTWPRAIIGNSRTEREKVGTGLWRRMGTIDVTFELEVPADQDAIIQVEQRWFLNRTDVICQQMQDLAGIGESVVGETHLNVQRISPLEGPWPVDPAEDDGRDVGADPTLSRWWSMHQVEWFG